MPAYFEALSVYLVIFGAGKQRVLTGESISWIKLFFSVT